METIGLRNNALVKSSDGIKYRLVDRHKCWRTHLGPWQRAMLQRTEGGHVVNLPDTATITSSKSIESVASAKSAKSARSARSAKSAKSARSTKSAPPVAMVFYP